MGFNSAFKGLILILKAHIKLQTSTLTEKVRRKVISRLIVTLYVHLKNCEKRLWASSCLSVCPQGTTPLPVDGFSWNLIFGDFFGNIGKFKFNWNRPRTKSTLHEVLYAFLSYLAHLFSERKMFQTKVVEKMKTRILCSVNFFPPENRAIMRRGKIL